MTGYAQALLVWERFGYPDFLTAEAEELVAGQYCDRPQLRPVLDAVLAALPALGPAPVLGTLTVVIDGFGLPGLTYPQRRRPHPRARVLLQPLHLAAGQSRCQAN